MKVVVTGAAGQLGLSVQVACQRGNIHCIPLDRDDLDIVSLGTVQKKIRQYAPDVVINAAAYTAVDLAEKEIQRAYAINQAGPKNLAIACEEIGAILLHVSTDYVFDGEKRSPYRETDRTNPLGVYGASKLAGEAEVMRHASDAVIVRTSWVFSEYGNNFLKTMLRLAQDRPRLTIVSDQIGCPTYAGDLAEALVVMAQGAYANKARYAGIYHYAGCNVLSWFQFAEKIFETARQERYLKYIPELVPIPTAQFPTLAKRPVYSVLDSSVTLKEFSLPSPSCIAGIQKSIHFLGAQ